MILYCVTCGRRVDRLYLVAGGGWQVCADCCGDIADESDESDEL